MQLNNYTDYHWFIACVSQVYPENSRKNPMRSAGFSTNLSPKNPAKFNFFVCNLSEALPQCWETNMNGLWFPLFMIFLFFASSCQSARQQFLLVSGVFGELKYDLFYLIHFYITSFKYLLQWIIFLFYRSTFVRLDFP